MRRAKKVSRCSKNSGKCALYLKKMTLFKTQIIIIDLFHFFRNSVKYYKNGCMLAAFVLIWKNIIFSQKANFDSDKNSSRVHTICNIYDQLIKKLQISIFTHAVSFWSWLGLDTVDHAILYASLHWHSRDSTAIDKKLFVKEYAVPYIKTTNHSWQTLHMEFHKIHHCSINCALKKWEISEVECEPNRPLCKRCIWLCNVCAITVASYRRTSEILETGEITR